MKAIVHTRYGPPEVAGLADIPEPTCSDNEILVRIHTATVTRTDSGFRSAEYVVSRFWSGLWAPKQQVLGCEFAGTVERTGKNVTRFHAGDRVFGYNDQTFGAHAQYITVPESGPVAPIPEHFSFDEAAPLTEGAHYALCNIRAAKIGKGDNVLVYGATGAIGSAAVQLLHYFGARITAVCGTKNVDLVKSLGADTVIDYQTQNFTKEGHPPYRFVFDAVGKSSFGQCRPLMTDKGIYISTELGKNGENIAFALFTPLFGGKRVLFPIPDIHKDDVEFLGKLAQDGHFKPVIDRIYPMEEIVEAYRYVESAQKTGNVLLRIP